ncbi:DUF6510 family protein [Isoptericola sediminis]|uniref:Uncharacterized protein n=1 Tax=Isoptericola sediminis TaxID=2733572 RepID=A0A849K166_9MICO|nr:DUF6510 family protein [Isoptericola sediminis]NNU26431.1 hypothetical protein [Isoptericola sediminis]
MEHAPAPLDGNCLAGPLAGFFTADVTVVTGCCRHCGDVAMMGASVVYRHPMGAVARCRACTAVLLVVVEHPDGTRVGMAGLAWWRLPVESGPG